MNAWWQDPAAQEALALGIVVLVVGGALVRWWRRRRHAATGCSGCHAGPRCPVDTDRTPGHTPRSAAMLVEPPGRRDPRK